VHCAWKKFKGHFAPIYAHNVLTPFSPIPVEEEGKQPHREPHKEAHDPACHLGVASPASQKKKIKVIKARNFLTLQDLLLN
jgi:hypothetical protein